jgi:hypothetical protein
VLSWLIQIKLPHGNSHISGIRCANDSRWGLFRHQGDFAAPVNGVIDKAMAGGEQPLS